MSLTVTTLVSGQTVTVGSLSNPATHTVTVTSGVPGPMGVSVSSASIVNSHLQIGLSNGTVFDSGSLTALEVDNAVHANTADVANNAIFLNGRLSSYYVYTLPTASTSTLGGIKVDGSTVTLSNGVLSVNSSLYQTTAGLSANVARMTANASTTSLTSNNALYLGGVAASEYAYANQIVSAYTLPAASNTTLGGIKIGSGLSIDGDGVVTAAGGGSGTGMATRTTSSVTTTSLTNNSQTAVALDGFKSYMILKIITSAAAWVRFYTDSASRASDYSRDIGTDPTPGSGVIAEFVTTGSQTVLVTPTILGFNADSPVSNSIPILITNKSGSTTSITVTAHLLQLEA